MLGGSLEENILTCLVYNDNLASHIALSIKSTDFSTQIYRKIAAAGLDFLDRHRCPARAHIGDLLEQDIRRGGRDGEFMNEVLEQMWRLAPQINEDYVRNSLDRFIDTQRLINAVNQASDLLREDGLEQAREVLHTADLMVRSPKDTPGVWLRDTDNWLAFLREREEGELFSSGIEVLDEYGVRPRRGELMAFLAASGMGKCVAAGTLVSLPSGGRMSIEEAVAQKIPEVLAYDEQTGTIVCAKVAHHWINGSQPLVRVVTLSGREIATTSAHHYLTANGWFPVEALRVGDYIALPQNLCQLGTKTYDKKILRLLGYLVADGGMTDPHSTTFTKVDPGIRKDFIDCVAHIGDRVTEVERSSLFYIVKDTPTRTPSGDCHTRALLDSLGLNGKKSRDKFVPDFIFELTDDCIAAFLQALLSCDGSLYVSGKGRKRQLNYHFEYSSASPYLARQVQHLLLRLGIVSRYREFAANLQGRPLPGYAKLRFTGRDRILRFLDVVGWSRHGSDRLIALIRSRYQDYNPALARTPGYIPINDAVVLEQICSIDKLDDCPTYDLAVERYHNFIAADIIVHNSWFLTNLGKHNVIGDRNRKKVLHITLENSLAVTTQRYTQCFLGLTSDEEQQLDIGVFKDPTDPDRVRHERSGPQRFQSVRGLSRDELARRLEPFQDRGELLVKHFPTGTLTLGMLNALLDSLERVENFKPDLLLLDYMTMMALNASDLRISIGQLARNLRGLADMRNCAVVTALQANREAAGKRAVWGSMVSEDWSTHGTTDTFLTYSQTAWERRKGVARILVDKGRNSTDKWWCYIEQAYAIGQFCTDSAYMYKQLAEQLSEDTDQE